MLEYEIVDQTARPDGSVDNTQPKTMKVYYDTHSQPVASTKDEILKLAQERGYTGTLKYTTSYKMETDRGVIMVDEYLLIPSH